MIVIFRDKCERGNMSKRGTTSAENQFTGHGGGANRSSIGDIEKYAYQKTPNSCTKSVSVARHAALLHDLENQIDLFVAQADRFLGNSNLPD
jgi:hypothetical protein